MLEGGRPNLVKPIDRGVDQLHDHRVGALAHDAGQPVGAADHHRHPLPSRVELVDRQHLVVPLVRIVAAVAAAVDLDLDPAGAPVGENVPKEVARPHQGTLLIPNGHNGSARLI